MQYELRPDPPPHLSLLTRPPLTLTHTHTSFLTQARANESTRTKSTKSTSRASALNVALCPYGSLSVHTCAWCHCGRRVQQRVNLASGGQASDQTMGSPWAAQKATTCGHSTRCIDVGMRTSCVWLTAGLKSTSSRWKSLAVWAERRLPHASRERPPVVFAPHGG